MDFDSIFDAQLAQLKEEGNYRIFAELSENVGNFQRPNAMMTLLKK